MNDMRCITSPRPFQCGRSKAITSTPGNASASAVTRGWIRPVADPDEERALVEPDRVATLGEHRLLESAATGTSAAASEAAIALGSPRLPSLPGRSSTAPLAPTSTGS